MLSLRLVTDFCGPFQANSRACSPTYRNVDLKCAIRGRYAFLRFQRLYGTLIYASVVSVFMGLIDGRCRLEVFYRCDDRSYRFFLAVCEPYQVQQETGGRYLYLQDGDDFRLFQYGFRVLFSTNEGGRKDAFHRFRRFEVARPVEDQRGCFIAQVGRCRSYIAG